MDNDIPKVSLSLSELPLSLRFILKSAAFLAHHKHLNPSEGVHFLIPIPMIVLEGFHSIIGLVLFILLAKVILTFFIRWKENRFSWRYIFTLKE